MMIMMMIINFHNLLIRWGHQLSQSSPRQARSAWTRSRIVVNSYKQKANKGWAFPYSWQKFPTHVSQAGQAEQVLLGGASSSRDSTSSSNSSSKKETERHGREEDRWRQVNNSLQSARMSLQPLPFQWRQWLSHLTCGNA